MLPKKNTDATTLLKAKKGGIFITCYGSVNGRCNDNLLFFFGKLHCVHSKGEKNIGKKMMGPLLNVPNLMSAMREKNLCDGDSHVMLISFPFAKPECMLVIAGSLHTGTEGILHTQIVFF